VLRGKCQVNLLVYVSLWRVACDCVTRWLIQCDDLTAWRVWSCDELTVTSWLFDELAVWRVGHVTSWLAAFQSKPILFVSLFYPTFLNASRWSTRSFCHISHKMYIHTYTLPCQLQWEIFAISLTLHCLVTSSSANSWSLWSVLMCVIQNLKDIKSQRVN